MSPPVKMWRYVVPHDANHEGWAIVILDSTGYFSTVSDFGNYAYLWTAHGQPDFRMFVKGLHRDWDYAATKLGDYDSNHRFDVEKTVHEIRKAILEARRSREFSKEQALQEWTEASDLDSNNISPEQWHERTSLGDPGEYCRYRRDSDLEAFCKLLLPRLSKLVQAELDLERQTTPSTCDKCHCAARAPNCNCKCHPPY